MSSPATAGLSISNIASTVGSTIASSATTVPVSVSSSASAACVLIPLASSPPRFELAQVPRAVRGLFDAVHAERQRDGAEALVLPREDDAQADELEQRQERHDHVAAARVVVEKLGELDPLGEREARQDRVHAL